MSNILAVDIGGSKTLIRLYRSDGEIEGEWSELGAGYATDSDEDIPFLRERIEQFKTLDICSIAVNLGGRNKGQITSIFKKVFPNVPLAVFRESEGTAAVCLGEQNGANIVLLAGTGSVAVAFDERGTVIGGGWGPNIGDDGSGYSIGLAAIRQSLLEIDRDAPLSALAQRICGLDRAPGILDATEYCSLRDDIRSRIGASQRRKVASYTKVVAELASKGEENAASILANAGVSLGELVGNAGRKMGFAPKTGVVVTGGLIACREHWQNEFEKTVRDMLGTENFIYVKDGVIKGTYEYARKIIQKQEECK